MNEFFHMGGFGAYIWSAMGVAALLMVLEPMTLMYRRRAVIAQIKRTKRLEERRTNNQKN
ncbi:hypothetical protein GCM10009133_23810 [Cocleimonas flava]|jgi:heme exporter protein D|uniref:Heme exporter protein D n=1 Tax=Cocleimonas flava TaxID=634765 RepID=A0A4V2P7S2_9GAMM|nr:MULTISPECIES: heme exporter protein CcmD [Cocleimonas]MEB8432482.1 heme exporter protein CcmD [Cocleimonas sp. KMM 6892]MEC4715341.1 heme exporter protein CcmD [Cocleimonas sp. KMM 6895]MEC4745040.1 heme exporter protein CcmD [Cocleimonas sp. KMM 6896]TCJ82915.1 heme exporter protein D [Cocleimonas flava]